MWLAPRLLQLIVRLARDPRVSGRTKSVLAGVVVYLASPVDLVPDFIPLLGYLDDVLLVAIVLDGLLNHVERAVVLEHWPGDPQKPRSRVPDRRPGRRLGAPALEVARVRTRDAVIAGAAGTPWRPDQCVEVAEPRRRAREARATLGA